MNRLKEISKILLEYIYKSLDLIFWFLCKMQSFIFFFSNIKTNTRIIMVDIRRKRKKEIRKAKRENKFNHYYIYLVMPTRLYSEIIKDNKIEDFPSYMEKMTFFSLLTSLIISLCFLFVSWIVEWNNLFDYLFLQESILFLSISWFFWILIFWWSISRIFEITYAFINDARKHLENIKSTSNIPYYKRIHLAMTSYLELIILFSILFFCMNSVTCAFNQDITVIDSIYFSGVTITTLGYGDIQPTFWMTKLLSVAEVICGFTLLVVSFTVYVSRAINDLEKGR